jgi:hypothetical protein
MLATRCQILFSDILDHIEPLLQLLLPDSLPGPFLRDPSVGDDFKWNEELDIE